MSVLEIVLLLAGGILAVLSFIVPVAGEEVPQETKKLAKEEIKTLVGQEMESIRQHVDDVVDEAVAYSMEKTERSLERLTNEKIMAVNEYSDTVLREIHKNHEETMFLYDMLNSKQANLKNMVSEVDRTVQEARETRREAEAVVNSFQQMKPEAPKTGVQRIRELQMAAEMQNKAAAQEKTETPEKMEAPGQAAAQEQAAAPEETAVREQTAAPEVSADETSSVEEKADLEPESRTPSVMDLNFMTEGQDAGTNNNEQILQLYRQGKSTVAIAKELGLGVGEVKLVIDLYKNL